MGAQAIEGSQSPTYYYGDLAEGVRRLQTQVAQINMARKMQAGGANTPLLDPLTLSARYCRRGMKFYGYNDDRARIQPRDDKRVKLALRILAERGKHAARTR